MATSLSRRRARRSWWTTAFMVPLACLIGMPFYYILVNTFKTQQQTTASPLALPSSVYLDNYVDVWNSVPVVRSFGNTIYVTVLSVVIMLLIGSLAAFGTILRNNWFTRIVGAALLLAFTIPFQTTLIPLYQLLTKMHLVDSLNGLVLLYSCGSIFCYFLIQGYMRTIPKDIIEAARIDGASSFTIFWRIVLPLIRPILVTVGVFQVMWVWNDFITPNVFISSSAKKTVVLQVYSAVGQFSVNWPAFMTLSVIVLIPMVIFFIFMQKHIVKGLVSGGVKG